ncbi:MAG: hypothetical protein WBV59_11265 [Anaerolineae bacterium]
MMTTNIERQPAYPALRPGESAAGAAPHRQQQAIVPDDSETFWGAVLGSLAGLGLATAGLAIGLGATGLAADTKSYWYLSRAAGFVAYLLLWGSVVWGMLLSSKIGKGKLRPPVLLDAHQFLSHVAVGFTLFHGLILMGDRYLSFPLRAVLVPFAGTYEPALVAAGQLGFWLLLLLVLSSHARKQLGQAQWRALHYTSFIAYWGVLLHAVMLGSDSQQSSVQVLYLVTAGAVLFLTLYRLLATEGRSRKAAAG